MWLLMLGGLAFADPPAPPPPPDLRVGPIAGVTTPTTLQRCLDVPPTAVAPQDMAGMLVFSVRVRRGKLAVVSTMRADPAVQPLATCFERELAAWTWAPRTGRFEVPVEVIQAKPPPLVSPPEPPAEPIPAP